jgi:hypothetical protein
MKTTILDTSNDAVISYGVRNDITMNKKTQKYSNESNTLFSKIGNDGKKQIANIKIISNYNREASWVP